MFGKLLVLFLFLINVFNWAGENPRTKINIRIEGLKNNSGTVKVALCNSLENYKNHKAPFRGLTLPIKNNVAEITIPDLPVGYYAVKVFHDENNNNDLDTNFLGIPIEDYGFSNNAKGIFGPPSWNKAKMFINEDSNTIVVKIN